MNLLSLFLVLFFLLFDQVLSQRLENNSTICSHIVANNLLTYLNFNKLDKKVDSVLSSNLYPFNNRIKLDATVSNVNPCPFRERVLQKMSRNETVNIVIVGGSNTYGMGIESSSEARLKYRWSNVFDNLINSGWYKGTFKVYNLAKGGWDVKLWSSRLDEIAFHNPDIILTDFTVNDYFMANSLDKIKTYEVFFKLLENLQPRPAVFSIFTLMTQHHYFAESGKLYDYNIRFNSTNYYYGKYSEWNLLRSGRTISNRYGIPYGNYRDVFWPEFFQPPYDIQQFWSGGHHVNETTHKYIADYMFNSFAYLLKDSFLSNKCERTIKNHDNIFNYCDHSGYVIEKDFDPTIRPVCYPDEILNLMEATTDPNSINSFRLAPSVNLATSKWKFYADSKSKYGWIFDEVDPEIKKIYDPVGHQFKKGIKVSDLNKDHLLSFVFNTTSIIQLSYLKSYPSYYASFYVWFDDDFNPTHHQSTLNSRWPDTFSVPILATYVHDMDKQIDPFIYFHLNRINFIDKTKLEHTIHFYPFPGYDQSQDRAKIKILGLLTC